MSSKCDVVRSRWAEYDAISVIMSKPYYASFFVHNAHQEAVTQYCGVIEMRRRNNKEIGPRELAVLLAKNLDVETDDVEVLQWGPVH
ncbi:MAG: hypothetical protein JSW21_02330 [Gammaproteobacteria bacterium]|nr:MAG: hypothetical protein JSW21_02330 [Gammaproteobacteria bacterium]